MHISRQVKIVCSRLVFGLPKNERENPADDERITVPLLFTGTRRGAINRRTFEDKSSRPAVLAAGITPTRVTGMQALRHFYASSLLDAGGEHQDPRVVPRPLRRRRVVPAGHRSLPFSLIYSATTHHLHAELCDLRRRRCVSA
ncbi:hypothetical protein [Micromonospora zamorensis]|uniref:hypothetical protein n=1 Tax=Micromonospora zamorensis TaxID=709883 RepID=UPI0033B953F6